MHVNAIINLLAGIALFVMMMSVGVGVDTSDVLTVARDWRVMLRAGVANYVVVPLVALGLLLVLHPAPMVAAGFLVAVVCPGAPFGPPFTAVARGKVVAAIGLMAVLAGSSAIIAPLLLRFLLPMAGGHNDLSVDPVKLVRTLILSQFLPLCLGLLLRAKKKKLSERLQKPCTRLSTLLNVSLITLILTVQFRMLANIRISGYLGMLAMVTASLMAGWMFGSGGDERKTLAITTATRNVGVALVIAAGSFPDTPAITSATAYAVFQTIAVLLVAMAWGRIASSKAASMKAAA